MRNDVTTLNGELSESRRDIQHSKAIRQRVYGSTKERHKACYQYSRFTTEHLHNFGKAQNPKHVTRY
jgi:hypothetical protein